MGTVIKHIPPWTIFIAMLCGTDRALRYGGIVWAIGAGVGFMAILISLLMYHRRLELRNLEVKTHETKTC